MAIYFRFLFLAFPGLFHSCIHALFLTLTTPPDHSLSSIHLTRPCRCVWVVIEYSNFMPVMAVLVGIPTAVMHWNHRRAFERPYGILSIPSLRVLNMYPFILSDTFLALNADACAAACRTPSGRSLDQDQSALPSSTGPAKATATTTPTTAVSGTTSRAIISIIAWGKVAQVSRFVHDSS